MMAPTHAAIGAVGFAGLAAWFGVPATATQIAVATLAALVPDIDTPHSRVGWCVSPLATWIERRYGHRTITHSALGLALFAALCAVCLLFAPTRPLWPALLFGYASHLMADALTKSGVPLAWPTRHRFVFPGNERLRFQTGSRAEWGLFLGLGVLALVIVPVAKHGPRHLFHLATGDLNGAIRDYEDFSGWECEAVVSGFSPQSQKPIEGIFTVVARQGEGALLVEARGERWILSHSDAPEAGAHWIRPRGVRVRRLRRLLTRPVTVIASNISIQGVCDALKDQITAAPEPWTVSDDRHFRVSDVTISGQGEVYAGEDVPTDSPLVGLKMVAFNGQSVAFNHARLNAFHASDAIIRRASLTLQLPLDVKAPRLDFPTRRVTLEARGMLRQADLLTREKSLVSPRAPLCRTAPQILAPEATGATREAEQKAKAARRELELLGVETDALQKTALWPQLAPKYAARRASLERLAVHSLPRPITIPAPPIPKAPFAGYVEKIEWEPPTIPTRQGERPWHSARLTLVQIGPFPTNALEDLDADFGE